MGLERNGQMVQAVLRLLTQSPDGLRASVVIAQVKGMLPPLPEEDGVYEANQTVKYDKILRFATIGPVKAGWLVKSKGVWTITDEGRRALDQYPDPRELMSQASKAYQSWKRSTASTDPDIQDVLPASEVVTSPEEAEEQSWRDVSNYLATMPPYDFQDLVAALLRAMGYHISWIAPPGKDGGIDVIAYIDPLGAQGPRVKVQVKRRADKVGVQELRSFLAVVSEKDVGVFISLGGYSPDAVALANQEQIRRVTLIDGQGLFDLWIEHLDKMTSEDKQRLPLKPIYFLNLEPAELA